MAGSLVGRDRGPGVDDLGRGGHEGDELLQRGLEAGRVGDGKEEEGLGPFGDGEAASDER